MKKKKKSLAPIIFALVLGIVCIGTFYLKSNNSESVETNEEVVSISTSIFKI